MSDFMVGSIFIFCFIAYKHCLTCYYVTETTYFAEEILNDESSFILL